MYVHSYSEADLLYHPFAGMKMKDGDHGLSGMFMKDVVSRGELGFDMLLCCFQLSGNGGRGPARVLSRMYPLGRQLHDYIQSWGWSRGGQEAGACERGGPRADKTGRVSQARLRSSSPDPGSWDRKLPESDRPRFESCLCCWPAV